MSKQTVYCLRIRPDDQSEWSETTYYRTRSARNKDERFNRVLGGMRTHSFEEKRTKDEIEELT